MIRVISILMSSLMIFVGVMTFFRDEAPLYGRTLGRSETQLFGVALAGLGAAYLVRDFRKIKNQKNDLDPDQS